MEGPASVTINNAAYPKHQEEEETPPNRNHIITNKHYAEKIALAKTCFYSYTGWRV